MLLRNPCFNDSNEIERKKLSERERAVRGGLRGRKVWEKVHKNSFRSKQKRRDEKNFSATRNFTSSKEHFAYLS